MSSATNLPADWLAQFDGTALEDKLGVSAILATATQGDWPHLAYLSCGEVLAVSPGRLRLYLWPGSGSAACLRTSGRASLHAAAGGIVSEARLTSIRLVEDDNRLMIETQVVETVRHAAPYARVTGMIGFELADPAQTLKRWEDQIARLRSFN